MKKSDTADLVSEVLDLGLWMGRSQAFGMLASKCSAAHAQCLKKLKEEEKHKALGLTWAQLCEKHLGLSRATADRIILQLERFGVPYFNLCQVIEISPETYQSIAAHVEDEVLECKGERIPITKENGRRIAELVRELRDEVKKARSVTGSTTPEMERHILTGLQKRMDGIFADFRDLSWKVQDPAVRQAVYGTMEEAGDGLAHLARERREAWIAGYRK